MGLKVIGANFGRTATMSLKQGLEILGFEKCYHMSEVVVLPEHVELWLDAWRGKDIWKTLNLSLFNFCGFLHTEKKSIIILKMLLIL